MRPAQTILSALAAGLLWPAASHAETTSWSDNLETNAGSHWTTNLIWKIGAPTSGPATNAAGFRTYAGSHCATTGLTGSAPANADSRFVCTNYNGAAYLFIPTNSPSPRLRFWQWYNFVNSGGFVEIQRQGSTNWSVVTVTNKSVGSTANSSSGVWSRPAIDLSAFAGTNVQVAFHFLSGGNSGADLGWFVDDLALVTNPPVFNHPENFETGLGDWAVDAGAWEVGQPTSGPGAAHGGTNCAGTVLGGSYGWNADTRLISPPFKLPASVSATLHFSQWYNFVNAGGFVEIKTNGGAWQSVTLTNRSVGSTAVNSTGWTNNTADLSAHVGQNVQLAFHFLSGGSGFASAAGWYVDDVFLTAPPVLTVPANQTFYAGQTLTVTNFATNSLATNATYTFALVSAPTNVAINSSSGALTWPTANAEPTSTNTLTVKVTDNSTALSATNSFVVTLVNPWMPLLTVPAPQTIFAGQTASAASSATNFYFPGSTFSFALPSGAPGASVTAAGLFVWNTTTAQAVGTYTNIIVATDNNAPNLSATNSFLVSVASPPSPALTVPATQNIYAGQHWSTTVSASNGAFPAAVYQYALNSAPTGVVINASSGLITWPPVAAQAPSVNTLSIKVTDNNSPPLGATNSFQVLVSPAPPVPTLTALSPQKISNTNGFKFKFLTQSNTTWRIEASTNLSGWLQIFSGKSDATGLFQFTDLQATNFPRRFYRAVYP